MASSSYKDELSKAQNTAESLSLEASFTSYDGTYIYKFLASNIVGDTIFTNGCPLANCILINNKEKSISNTNSLPKGYYSITSVFLTADIDSKELANDIYSYVKNGYSINIKVGSTIISEQSQLSDAFAKNGKWLGSAMKQEELNNKLQLYCQKNKTISFNESGIRLNPIYCLENTENGFVYYAAIPMWVESNFMPVRYFNFINSELKGKDVFMTYSGNKNDGTGFYRSAGSKSEIKDILTGKTVIQKDTLFHCIDVIVDSKDDGSNMKVCCILEGKNTGKIALNVVRLIDKYDEDRYDDPNLLNYYKSSTGEWSIWQESYNQKKDGMMIRGRHFDAAFPDGDNKLFGDAYRRIIKVDDLKSIIEDTKKNLVLAADKQKQVAAKYYAWQSYKLYNLCHQYGEKYGPFILDHKITLGMTPQMCKESWGLPIRIVTGINEKGCYTEWIYNYNRYIFFVNNKVVEILY